MPHDLHALPSYAIHPPYAMDPVRQRGLYVAQSRRRRTHVVA